MKAISSKLRSPMELAARDLYRHLAVVRNRRQKVNVALGLLRTLIVVLAYLIVETVLDRCFEFPWGVRAGLLLIGLAATTYTAWKFLLYPLRHKPKDDEIALSIEGAMPVFCSRFIASIQLARSSDHSLSVPLVRALVRETTQIASTLDFRHVVRLTRLRHLAKLGGSLLLLAMLLFVVGGKFSIPLLKRAVLFTDPLPRNTQIIAITGARTVGVGEDLAIEVEAKGSLPRSGKLWIQPGMGPARESPLDADPAMPGKFSRTIRSVQETFSYSVKLNDATSATFEIKVLPRPEVLSLSCEETFPAYTRLAPVRRKPGDLALLAGSVLKLSIKASTEIQAAELLLTGLEKVVPIAINASDARELSVSVPIPAKGLTGFSIHLVDREGVNSKGGADYRIQILPDQLPEIKIIYPDQREELVTPEGALLIGFEARDDFGIGKLMLHYQYGEGSTKTEASVELDLGAQSPKTLSRRFEWQLSTLWPRPEMGSPVEYWIEVLDTNNVTGPGSAKTERYAAKIVSAQDKRSDLANRLFNTVETLNEVATDQQKTNETLGTLIFAKPTR